MLSVQRDTHSKWNEVSRNPPITDPVILWGLCQGAAWAGGFLGLGPVGGPPGQAEQGLASWNLWQWDVPRERDL